MKKKIIILIILLFNILCVRPVSAEEALVKYQTHIQNVGWQNYVNNGQTSGTTGRALRLEGIKIIVDSDIEGSIEYQTHVQNVGWQGYVKDDELAGTTGRSLRLEAIRIRLTGELAEKYSVLYQVHIQNIGWQNWVKDGELAGTTGKSLRLEAIRIKLVSKEEKFNITYKTYIQNDGWQDDVENGELSGTVGESKSIQAININFVNYTDYKGNINYSIYTAKNGWSNYVNSGTEIGKAGTNIEAIKIKITDALSEKYDIYYRTHVSNTGWLGWTKNDGISGSMGYFRNVEAIEIKFVEKNDTSINEGSNSYIESKNEVLTSTHVQSIGWMDYVDTNKTAGTEGKALRLEAFKMKIDSKLGGNIEYTSYVELLGWQNFVSNNVVSGTSGMSKRIEAIQVKLTGKISEYYDIYYRVHVSNIGWLDWAKNGEKAGSIGSNSRIESIQVKLVVKGNPAPGATSKKYVTGTWNGKYYYDYFRKKVTGIRYIDGVKYYFDTTGYMVGKDVKKVIDVSYAQGTGINWNTIKQVGDIDAAIIRIGYGAIDEGIIDKEGCGEDDQFARNIGEVKKLNIPYSIYIFAYAKTEGAVLLEADFVKKTMEKYNLPKDTFIWYDAELNYPKSTYEKIVPKFVNKMKEYGYNNVGVYSNLYRLIGGSGVLNSTKIRSYPLWVAQYNDTDDYPGEHMGWQYTSSGRVDGVSGNVDISVFYK